MHGDILSGLGREKKAKRSVFSLSSDSGLSRLVGWGLHRSLNKQTRQGRGKLSRLVFRVHAAGEQLVSRKRIFRAGETFQIF